MALVKGLNSWGSMEEADAYFEDRLDAAAWDEAVVTERSKALVTATTVLDSLSYNGRSVALDQTTAFPRDICYFDPRLGRSVETQGTPKRALDAWCEMAYHLLNNDGLLDDTGGLTNLEVASIKLIDLTSAKLVPDVVLRLITPLLKPSTPIPVWRAW